MAMKYLDKYPRKGKLRGLLVPMWATLKMLFRTTNQRPMTIMYPYEKEWVPDNYRGRPGLVFDKCIGCGICKRMCPTTCIDMVEVADDAGKNVKRPQVNLGRCMMCGYCAEYCPTDAMTVTPDYELAAFTRQELIYGPRKLHYEGTTEGMEVHLEETLLSDIEKGVVGNTTAFHKVDRPELNFDTCIGCGRCVKVCPTDVIEMYVAGQNDKGKDIKRPKFDYDKCVCCENCVDECPKDSLKIKEVL